MSKRNEKISAHLDGEIHRDELMSFSLSAEVDDAATSVRYQMIGDVLRDEVSELSMQDISVAVREALLNETLVPAATPVAALTSIDSTSEGAASGLMQWLSAGWLRPLGGMAVAATVAVVMVVAVTQKNQPVASQMAQARQVQPVVPVTIASDHPLQTAPVQSMPAASYSELNPYLNQHFATQGTLQSRMPYVRAVSYESGK